MKMVDNASTVDNSYFGIARSSLGASKSTWEIPGHVPASPFRIRIVRTPEQLRSAVNVRYQAYSRRLQALASKVRQPGPLDYSHDPVILLAEDQTTGQAVGTLRLNTGPGVLNMLDDIDLPDNIVLERVAFVSRMAVTGTVHERNLVRSLMQKAVFQLCIAKQLNRILLLAVQPRERLFYRWGFSDVFADGEARFPALLERFPVKALFLDSYAVERLWREQGHPLYDFLFGTFHPEIEVFSSLSSISKRSNESTSEDRETHSTEPLWVS